MDIESTNSFKMHNVREAMLPGDEKIERMVKALEGSMLAGDNGYVFDLSKSLIETTCKRIIDERGAELSGKDNLSKLIKTAFKLVCTGFESVENPNQARESLGKAINGLTSAVVAISELRNLFGEVSHGRGAKFVQIGRVHASMVALSADNIVSYLLQMHRATTSAQATYSDHSDFNDWVDELNDPVKIFSSFFKPSEILFTMDIGAYQEALNDYESDKTADMNQDASNIRETNSNEATLQ